MSLQNCACANVIRRCLQKLLLKVIGYVQRLAVITNVRSTTYVMMHSQRASSDKTAFNFDLFDTLNFSKVRDK